MLSLLTLALKVLLSSWKTFVTEGAFQTMMTPRQGYKPLVLCVDDDQGILDLTRMALEGNGYRVLTANGGTAALEAFAVCPVDAVVLDYDMPGMNGCQVAQEMMRIKPHVPKLLFSATTMTHDKTRAFQSYCSKPTSLFTLTSHVGAMTAFAGSAPSNSIATA